MNNRLAALLLGALAFLALPDKVSAAQAQGLPWEGPLAKLQASLSGPVAGAISIIAIVICGAALSNAPSREHFGRRHWRVPCTRPACCWV
jgi:type IV secretion system protein VirB2